GADQDLILVAQQPSRGSEVLANRLPQRKIPKRIAISQRASRASPPRLRQQLLPDTDRKKIQRRNTRAEGSRHFGYAGESLECHGGGARAAARERRGRGLSASCCSDRL